jgi:selenocysteine lyase/cysteine desulfurase
MPTGLYLDSARLGLMPPRARRAHHEFVRLVGREGASAAVIDFLRDGADSWPRAIRCRYPDLGDWQGIDAFLQALRSLTGAPISAEVLVASHSAPLMRLAAHLLCQTCRVILHTDLEWPAWLEILRAEATRHGRRLVGVPVRELLVEDRAGIADLIERLARGYRRSAAEGLFLTEITHEGIRLPLTQLVGSLETTGVPRFVVVDTAQALGHVPLELKSGPGDVYLSGCHKWVGSGLPLSIAIAPKQRAGDLVRRCADTLINANWLDDPLLRFTRTLSSGDLDRAGGTVNLAPLFPASAAVSIQLGRANSAVARHGQRLENRRVLSLMLRSSGWEPVTPHPDFQSGILLMKTTLGEARDVSPDRLQSVFRRQGVALTGFPGGIIRASLPDLPWSSAGLGAVLAAFRRARLEVSRRESGASRTPAGRIESPRQPVASRLDGSL